MSRRLTMIALGSRGDVQPYVALASGLLRAGHRVRMVTFESFRPMVESQGLDFHPVAGDAHALVAMMMGGSGIGTRNPLVLMRSIMRSFGALADAYIDAFSADVLADSDAILNQLPAGLFGADVAEKLGVPHLMLSVIPLEQTAAFANPLLSSRSFGALGNRLTYSIAAQLLWAGFRPIMTRFRRRLGLSGGLPLWLRPRTDPVINGFSPLVVPPPPDWGAHIQTTGYWLLDEADWQPPAPLLDFLQAGDPPVFIGFGSMVADDPARLTRLLIEAVDSAGCRAVFGKGWANLGAEALPAHIHALDYTPYPWLLPRMAAVVHHGGSGTTGQALRAGVPSMVVAFGTDPPFCGARTAALGAGLPPLHIKSLTAEALARSLRTLLTDDGMRARAAELGASLRAERGIETAIRIIEGYVGGGGK